MLGARNETIKLFLGISLGIFLFILFFEPFSLNRFDFNNRLLFVAGIGGIIFIILMLVHVITLLINKQKTPEETDTVSYLSDFIFLILGTAALSFYLRYVGSVKVSFYLVFKLSVICLAAPVIIRMFDNRQRMKRELDTLIADKKNLQKQVVQCKEDGLKKDIEFVSENKTENLILLLEEVILIKSADNYIEIVYHEGEAIRKKLLRNTLRNIEIQLRPYTFFVRCHRTCIVNTRHVEKLNRSYGNHSLSLKGYAEKIPVSRQYLLKLREVL